MKCDKTSALAFALLISGVTMQPAFATDAPLVVQPAAAATTATVQDSGAPTSLALTEVAPAGTVAVATPTAVIDEGVPPAKVAPAVKADKDDPIPQSVTSVVEDLRKSETNVSLDDIARAQDALTRLDLLLDIQKRINDIQKEREDGNDIHSKGMHSMPAGAFNLPMPAAALGTTALPINMPAGIQPANMGQMPAMDLGGSASNYEVQQIVGINGHYKAVVMANGSKKTVEQGDKIGRYSVQKISATGVTLSTGNDRKVLTVESNGTPVMIRSR